MKKDDDNQFIRINKCNICSQLNEFNIEEDYLIYLDSQYYFRKSIYMQSCIDEPCMVDYCSKCGFTTIQTCVAFKGTEEAEKKPNKIELWSEGCGFSWFTKEKKCKAKFHGEYEGATIRDVVELVKKCHFSENEARFYDSNKLTYKNRQLFDNESDARKRYG